MVALVMLRLAERACINNLWQNFAAIADAAPLQPIPAATRTSPQNGVSLLICNLGRSKGDASSSARAVSAHRTNPVRNLARYLNPGLNFSKP